MHQIPVLEFFVCRGFVTNFSVDHAHLKRWFKGLATTREAEPLRPDRDTGFWIGEFAEDADIASKE